jgi:hypothetical protein
MHQATQKLEGGSRGEEGGLTLNARDNLGLGSAFPIMKKWRVEV